MIKSEKAIIGQLLRLISGRGLPNAISRESVTGNHRAPAETQKTNRGKRDSTEASTASASTEAPKSCVNRKKGSMTKKRKKAQDLLPCLFDIAADDECQPPAKLGFLHDQRTERKCRLPPVIGILGVERRRIESTRFGSGDREIAAIMNATRRVDGVNLDEHPEMIVTKSKVHDTKVDLFSRLSDQPAEPTSSLFL